MISIFSGNNYNKTCQEYAANGFNISGNFRIDVDGPDGPLHPFEVFCNFTNDVAETVVDIAFNLTNGTNVTYS